MITELILLKEVVITELSLSAPGIQFLLEGGVITKLSLLCDSLLHVLEGGLLLS